MCTPSPSNDRVPSKSRVLASTGHDSGVFYEVSGYDVQGNSPLTEILLHHLRKCFLYVSLGVPSEELPALVARAWVSLNQHGGRTLVREASCAGAGPAGLIAAHGFRASSS